MHCGDGSVVAAAGRAECAVLAALWQGPVLDETARADAMRSSARPAHLSLPEDGVSTAEQEEHSGSRASSRRGSECRDGYSGAVSLGLVWPWLKEDVVLYLSNDGDSASIFLLCDRIDGP
jgi:hypothetical protein